MRFRCYIAGHLLISELFNLAQRHHQSGQLVEAEKIYRQILSSEPNHAGATHLLGLVLFQRGRPLEAYPLMKRGVELDPGNGAYHANLGAVCRALGRLDEAAGAYRQSLALTPNVAATWNNLGNLQADLEQFDEAVASFRMALKLDPSHPNAQFNIAKTLADSGRFTSAFVEYRKGLTVRPSAREHSDLLLELHYPDGLTPAEIFEEHRKFDRLYALPLRSVVSEKNLDRSPDRPLRIGYVSPDFRQHPVAQLVEPLLANHDRAQFKIYCYSDAPPEQVLQRLRGYADRWADTHALADEQMAQLISNDQIDILFDLAGHTRGNRQLVFARKPALIQVTHLGYPDTTGLSAIDYRLTDTLRDPAAAGDQFYAEKSLRLPSAAWCYRPFDFRYSATELPALRNGYVTFGSMNNLRKITPAIVQLWAQILRQLPTARLAIAIGLTKGPAGFGGQRLRRQFADLGIAESRLQFIERCSQQQYLKNFQQIDIALDTFPYHGGVTTLDALWMGVPVVVLAGNTYVSRVGFSLLSQVGLNDLIAATAEEYVKIAVDLAQQIPRLSQLHDTLHDRFVQSPLMDGPVYARDVEAALRQIWRGFCSR